MGALLLAALLLGAPEPLLAHLDLRSSRPAAGAVLDTVPDALRLDFTQAVELPFSRVTLAGPGGIVELGEVAVAPGSAGTLVIPIRGPLAVGEYTVRWQTASADGHPIQGEFSFAIAAGAAGLPAPPQPSGAPERASATPSAERAEPVAPPAARFDSRSPLYAAVRWLTFTGLLAVIGASSFALLVLPSVRRRERSLGSEVLELARARAAFVGLAAGWMLLVAVALRLAAQSAAVHGTGAGLRAAPIGAMLTQTLWGWGWLAQSAAAVAALLGFWLARRGHRLGWGVAAGAVLALSVTPGLSGHAAAASATAVVVDGLHVLAAGGWLGTLLLVVLVGLPVLASQGSSPAAPAATLIAAFSPLALAFAGVLTLTGLYSAWLHLPGLAALWSTAYGRTLLLKLAVLSVVFATGAYNWLRARPALERSGDPRPLRRSAAAELFTGLLVLAVTAALVATPPPPAAEEPGAAPPARSAQ